MPLPGQTLFPSPFLLPGGPTPFSDLIVDATSPWNDPNGFWATYNASLAAMFEQAYDIIADTGDPNQTIVATLSSTLDTSTPITSLAVQGVSQFMQGGTELTLSSTEGTQFVEVATPANIGDTVIEIETITPNFPYPSGTAIQVAYFPGWSLLLDPVNCPDTFLPFLAQFNGADVPLGSDSITARAKIISESGLQRGTLAAVTSAVTRNLNGTQSLVIVERVDSLGDANAYWFIVIVRPEEVIDVNDLTDAVNSVKPGGVQWTLVQTDGWTITQMELSEATLTALEGDFVTLTGLEQDRLGT